MMKREKAKLDVVILGAGPSGLTAAYKLSREGVKVVVVERAAQTGGLMTGIRHGDFTFDLGRKELYSRLPDVHDLWTELLGDDYRVYPHHVGLLYGGRILERSSAPRGAMRGMSSRQVARLAASFLWNQIRPGPRRATDFESYHLLRYGAAFYDYFAHGFNAKLEGCSPRQLPPPFGEEVIPRFAFLRQRLARTAGTAFPSAPASQEVWRHPARGTLQIVESLEAEARAAGATFLLSTDVLSVDATSPEERRVLVRDSQGETKLSAASVISGIPLPLLAKLLRPAPPAELRTVPRDEIAFRKSVLLVYLMADGEPRFPHNWLEVNDFSTRAGRIVNYATWNGSMVPAGKTGLCLEYFCLEGDSLTRLSDPELIELASIEAVRNGLLRREAIFDSLVVRLPSTNAATVLTDWKLDWMRRTSRYVASLGCVYDANRPGTDYATLAGIDAAIACQRGEPMSDRSLEPVGGAR
jgi:protoporphyrinogen oxidase